MNTTNYTDTMNATQIDVPVPEPRRGWLPLVCAAFMGGVAAMAAGYVRDAGVPPLVVLFALLAVPIASYWRCVRQQRRKAEAAAGVSSG